MRPTVRLLIVIAAVVIVVPAATAKDINWITKDELRDALGSDDLTIIDVRIGRDWSTSDAMIKGAVREDPGEMEQWAKKYPKDGRLVFY